MNDAANTESLADIVNELRRGDTHGAHRVYTIPRRNTKTGYYDIEGVSLDDLADRIEAAAKREMSKGLSKKMDKNHDIPGNPAALREALEKFLDLARRGLAFYTSYEYTEEENDELEEAFANAKSALAAPARNCDRYRTADEAREAHANSDDWLMAFGDWLFAPAKERKGETDGDK